MPHGSRKTVTGLESSGNSYVEVRSGRAFWRSSLETDGMSSSWRKLLKEITSSIPNRASPSTRFRRLLVAEKLSTSPQKLPKPRKGFAGTLIEGGHRGFAGSSKVLPAPWPTFAEATAGGVARIGSWIDVDYLMDSSSISKMRVALGGITLPAPCSP